MAAFVIFFLTLALAAGSSSLPVSAMAQHHPADGDRGFMLVDLKANEHDGTRLALRTGGRGGVSLVGFANRSHHWFALPGSEHLTAGGLRAEGSLAIFSEMVGRTWRDLQRAHNRTTT